SWVRIVARAGMQASSSRGRACGSLDGCLGSGTDEIDQLASAPRVGEMPVQQSILIDVEERKVALLEQRCKLVVSARRAQVTPLVEDMDLAHTSVSVGLPQGDPSAVRPGSHAQARQRACQAQHVLRSGLSSDAGTAAGAAGEARAGAGSCLQAEERS